MATCENDHDPITFEGEFRALCPLCAMRSRITEEKDKEIEEAKQDAQDWEDLSIKSDNERDEVLEKLDKMEEERDGWEARAKELQAELDKLKGAL